MSFVPILVAVCGLGVVVSVIGILVSFRSVKAGHGASPSGIAINVSGIVLTLLAVTITFLVAIAKSGLWLLAILIIPIPAFAIVLVVGAVQGLQGRHRP